MTFLWTSGIEGLKDIGKIVSLYFYQILNQIDIPCFSYFSPIWNLGSLLDLTQVPVFSKIFLHVLDYSDHINPSLFEVLKYGYPKLVSDQTVPKFCIQRGWITGSCHYSP